jgi:hypothetical protein
MAAQPPPGFLAIREALLAMTPAERRYLQAWLQRWIAPDGRVNHPSVFYYPPPIDWGDERARKP